MKPRSLIFGTLFVVALSVLLTLSSRQALAAERPPNLVRTAPIIPWARPVGDHRYRSPRNYDDTLRYYRKVLRGNWNVSWKKIINVSAIRAKHIKNNKKNGCWEGLNIYEHKGAAYIFVVYTDAELAKIAEEKNKKAKKKAGKR